MTELSYKLQIIVMVVNDTWLKKQPADIQQAILEGGRLATENNRKMIAEMETDLVKVLKDKGVEILAKPEDEPVWQEKAMAVEDRIVFFLSDNLMHHMIFSIACRINVWSWLEETNADLERFRWLRAATQVLDNQDIVNEHKQIRRAIAGRDPIEASFLVSKHLHMMFRNQTEVLDQFPEYFETSKLR